MKKFPRLLLLAIAAWYLIGLPPLLQSERDKHAISLRVLLRSSVASMIQVFYDTGQGIREEDSVHKPSVAGGSTLYNFPLATTKVLALRIDPLTTAGEVTIASAAVVDANGKPLRVFALTDFTPGNQIKSLSQTGAGLQVVTDDPAPDPSLKISLPEPLSFPAERNATAKAWAKTLVWHTLSGLAVAGIAAALASLIRARWGRGWLDFSLPPGEEIEWIPVEFYLYMPCALGIVAASAFYLEQMLYQIIP